MNLFSEVWEPPPWPRAAPAASPHGSYSYKYSVLHSLENPHAAKLAASVHVEIRRIYIQTRRGRPR